MSRIRIESLPIVGQVIGDRVVFLSATVGPAVLDDAARPGRHLIARCDCGRSEPLDARPWFSTGQGWRSLSALSSRLRCGACGRRSVPLEVGEGEALPCPERRIFIFR